MSVQMNMLGYADVPADQAQVAPLSTAQREILRYVREYGEIRAVKAGTIVHAGRSQTGCNKLHPGYRGEGCCGYAASDGTDACKRLVKRGLLVRTDDGYAIGREVCT